MCALLYENKTENSVTSEFINAMKKICSNLGGNVKARNLFPDTETAYIECVFPIPIDVFIDEKGNIRMISHNRVEKVIPSGSVDEVNIYGHVNVKYGDGRIKKARMWSAKIRNMIIIGKEGRNVKASFF